MFVILSGLFFSAPIFPTPNTFSKSLYEFIVDFLFGIISKLPPLSENSNNFFMRTFGMFSISFNTINCCFGIEL